MDLSVVMSVSTTLTGTSKIVISVSMRPITSLITPTPFHTASIE